MSKRQRQNKSFKAGMSHNDYIIAKILAPCPFEFKKEGIWYKRPKKGNRPWQEVW